jgi:transcriptional regulator with XRE-family HTH domain
MLEQNITIGKKIKALRIKNEMSIEDVSKKTGISEDVILDIEKNAISPPLGNIVSLADVLRVTVGELFGDSADSPFCIVRSDNRKAVSRFSSIVGKSRSPINMSEKK